MPFAVGTYIISSLEPLAHDGGVPRDGADNDVST